MTNLYRAIKSLPTFVKIVRKGEFIGDSVILKSQFGRFDPSPQLSDFVESAKSRVPDFSDIDFRSMPPGSFGHEYFRFMTLENLKPFKFSGKYLDIMSENYLPILYATVHDFFHVLAGYDASLAGEAAVWGVVAGQNISPQAERAVKMAKLLYPMVSPTKRKLIVQAANEGVAIGRSARPLITMDFRANFPRLLADVRRDFAVSPTQIETLRF